MLHACACAALRPAVERRDVLVGAPAALHTALVAPGVAAAAAPPPDGSLTTLRRRVGQRVTTARPSYGLDASDVYYPDFFEGSWRTTSAAVDVQAPLGAALFGGNASLAAALKELRSPPVVYDCRFVRDARGRLVADRPYNIQSLAAATMGGAGAVRDLPDSANFNPDDLTFKLAPEGSGGGVYLARLRALARRYEPAAGEVVDGAGRRVFDVGELTRQQLSLPGGAAVPPSVKDIETINCFTRLSPTRVAAVQRTSTWLVATEGYAAMRAQAADGRAVDIRTYDVLYERL